MRKSDFLIPKYFNLVISFNVLCIDYQCSLLYLTPYCNKSNIVKNQRLFEFNRQESKKKHCKPFDIGF